MTTSQPPTTLIPNAMFSGGREWVEKPACKTHRPSRKPCGQLAKQVKAVRERMLPTRSLRRCQNSGEADDIKNQRLASSISKIRIAKKSSMASLQLANCFHDRLGAREIFRFGIAIEFVTELGRDAGSDQYGFTIDRPPTSTRSLAAVGRFL